jgi:lipoprotein NlpI
VLRLIDGDEETATDYFRTCVETEIRNYYEYYGAMAELRRMGKSVALNPG